MHYNSANWSLRGTHPYSEQETIVKDILKAIDKGYKNIILEAGTGTGKSAIATTIANHMDSTYIITMTNQLLQQYLNDFGYMVKQIKGRSNYQCNYEGTCEECYVEEQNRQRFESYLKALKTYNENPAGYTKPKKPDKIPKCKEDSKPTCPYLKALQEALKCDKCITNYDYLHFAGNYAGIPPERDLIIFDESHNFESKVMQLTCRTLNRKVIYKDYNIDIFDGVAENKMALKDLKHDYDYWIKICEKIISIITSNKSRYIASTYEDISKMNNAEYKMLTSEDDVIKSYDNDIKRFARLIDILDERTWIIELPTRKAILADETYFSKNKERGLTVEFKPLTVNEYTNSLLHFGETRLFLTGTLGNKELFCRWNGIDPDETFYIYHKSPFDVSKRPIHRCYLGRESQFRMAGSKTISGERVPNWKNDEAMFVVHDILEKHHNEKGVIHVSSKEQAWWIKNELKDLVRRPLRVASGKRREEVIEEFEDNPKNMVLISPSVKDGVDFKGDKCRFQIIFKCPFPMLQGEQINKRKYFDNKWYIYQTVMPLMQAYGRGIRDNDDYCTTYVIDSSMEGLLHEHVDLFNEYFLEAIVGFDWKDALEKCKRSNGNIRRVRRVKRIPRVQSEAK